MSESVVVEHLGAQTDVVAERRLDGEDCLGEVVLVDVPDVRHRVLPLGFGLLGSSLRECLPTPDTGLLLAGRLLLAPRTDDGPNGVGFVGLDVEAVGARNLALVRIVEHGDVPRSDGRATGPAVMVFEVGLADALAGEIRRRALPEVRGCDGLGDLGAAGDFLQDVADAVVRDRVRRRELAEQGVSVAAGMVVEPLPDVGDRGDEDGRPPAGLPVESDLQAVLVVGDRADREVEELAGPRAEVPGETDERAVPGVEAGVEHRLDVVVPVQHLGRVRRGVVVLRIAAGDPLDALGVVVAVGDDLPDVPERDAIVLVRLGAAGLFAVNPADETLGGVTVALGGVGEPADLFGEFDAAPEEELVAVVGELAGPEQSDLVGELEENLAVGLGDVVGVDVAVASGVGVTEPGAHGVDGGSWVLGHLHISTQAGHVKDGCRTLPGHNSEAFDAQNNHGAERHGSSPHQCDELRSAIATSPAETTGSQRPSSREIFYSNQPTRESGRTPRQPRTSSVAGVTSGSIGSPAATRLGGGRLTPSPASLHSVGDGWMQDIHLLHPAGPASAGGEPA